MVIRAGPHCVVMTLLGLLGPAAGHAARPGILSHQEIVRREFVQRHGLERGTALFAQWLSLARTGGEARAMEKAYRPAMKNQPRKSKTKRDVSFDQLAASIAALSPERAIPRAWIRDAKQVLAGEGAYYPSDAAFLRSELRGLSSADHVKSQSRYVDVEIANGPIAFNSQGDTIVTGESFTMRLYTRGAHLGLSMLAERLFGPRFLHAESGFIPFEKERGARTARYHPGERKYRRLDESGWRRLELPLAK